MKARTRKLTNVSKLILKILLTGILLTSLSSVVFAEANESLVSINEQTSAILSIDEAKEIAAFSVVELSGAIPELSEWGNAVIEPDITYYDLEENITAYAFNVMKNSEYDGYIIIPATKDKYPILEFSKGKLPHKISTMAKKSQCTVSNHANKNKLNIGKSIPIYVSNVVSEINANRPFVLCMYGGGARVGGSNDYGNHAVTCMGYYYEGTTQYLNLHDGWDQSATHYITYGNWDSVIPVWMRP